jgi:hypothetical protein
MSASNAAGTNCCSNPIYFQISASTPDPAIAGIDPGSLVSGPSPQALTINGSGFSAGSSVVFAIPGGGAYQVVSSSYVQFFSGSITVQAPLSLPGAWTVQVTNSNGKTSNAYPFQVAAAAQKPGSFQLAADTSACNASPSLQPLLRISWGASAQAVSYTIYRSSYAVSTVQSDVLSWSDPSNLGAGATYNYYVVANNPQGSTPSNTVVVSVPYNVCYLQPAGKLLLNSATFNSAFTQGQSAAYIGLQLSTDSGKAMRGTGVASTQQGGNWLTVNGGTSWTWTAPEGDTVGFDPTGLAPGVYSGSITLSSPQASNSSVVVPVTMIISAPLIITSSTTLPDATPGQIYNSTLQATGGSGLTWTIENGSLPAGLTLDRSTGVISGTVGQDSGTRPLNISVRDLAGRYAWLTFTLNWRTPIGLFFNGGDPVWSVGTPVQNFVPTVTVYGGTPPYQWSATGLPSGVSMDAAGNLTGTPSVAGTYPGQVLVTDSTGLKGVLNVSFRVVLIPIRIFDPSGHELVSIPSGVAGTAYQPGGSASFSAQGGTQQGFQWTVTGALPPGMATSPSPGCTPPGCGLLFSGTPSMPGLYPLTIQVTDSGANSMSTFVVLVINKPGTAPKISAANLPLAIVGQGYAFALSATGGTGALTWKIAGPLPDASLAVSSGGGLTANPTVPNDCEAGPRLYLPPQYPVSRALVVVVADAIGQSDALPFCMPVYYPQPQIQTISPPYVVPTGLPVTVTVQGQNFQPGSQVQLVNIPQPTTFISSTALQFTLNSSKGPVFELPSGSQLSSGSNYTVRVLSPYTFASNIAKFAISLPPPAIKSVQNHLFNS